MRKIHMMGIGGIGMSAIAELSIKKGDLVTGCDARLNYLTDKLRSMGAAVYEGHDSSHIFNDTDILVYSSALKKDHPEIIEANRKSVRIMRRAEMLSDVVGDKKLIAVTGTHGKTTTTFMITHVFNHAGMSPCFAAGGEMDELGGNAGWGSGEYFIAEADESDGTQRYLKPDSVVVTNIDCDHMENYSDISHIASVMREFLGKVPDDGFVVGFGEDLEVAKMLKNVKAKAFSYGFNSDNDICAADIQFGPFSSEFDIIFSGKKMGRVMLNIPGRHNVLNALACAAICLNYGIPFKEITAAFGSYPGVRRRLDVLFSDNNVMIIDDYAHHPSEIRAVVNTVKGMAKGRCMGVFQPHRYSRTKYLHEQFADCFEGLDEIVLTDIYGAGELPITGIDGKLIYDVVVKNGGTEAVYIESKNKILEYILPRLKSGDVLVFMGAGDITDIAHKAGEILQVL